MFNAGLTRKYVYPGDFAVNIPAVGKKKWTAYTEYGVSMAEEARQVFEFVR